jgi:cell wall-associated NlpC family hydrolase
MTSKSANLLAILLLFLASSCNLSQKLTQVARREKPCPETEKQAEQARILLDQQRTLASLANQTLPTLAPQVLPTDLPAFHTQIVFVAPLLPPTPNETLLANQRNRHTRRGRYQPSPVMAPAGLARGFLAGAAASPAPDQLATAKALPCGDLRNQLVDFAKQFIGTRYRHGGKRPGGFDCSGFTSYVLGNFNYHVSPSSAAQAYVGQCVDFDKVQKGDLLIFGYWGKGGSFRTSHAALVISEQGEPVRMIHSARRGVTIDEVGGTNWRSYYAKRLLFARRVIHDGPDLQALLGMAASVMPMP